MKGFGFRVLLFMIGTALMCLCFSSKTITSSVPDMAEKDMAGTGTSRKLKDHDHTRRNEKSDGGSLNLEDYGPVDPVPSSMASTRPGPIQHGTPLMPYIPKPSPPAPDHPNHAEFP